MKNRNDTLAAESPEQLVTNLRKLLADAESLMADSAGEHAEAKLDQLHAALEQAQARLQAFYGHAREKVVIGAKRADETIRSHPYESLAVALGVGVLLGALLRRGGN